MLNFNMPENHFFRFIETPARRAWRRLAATQMNAKKTVFELGS